MHVHPETLREICKNEELKDMLVRDTTDNLFGVTVIPNRKVPEGKALRGTWEEDDMLVIDEVI